VKIRRCAATVYHSRNGQSGRPKSLAKISRVNPEQEKSLESQSQNQSFANHFTPAEVDELTDVAERLRAPLDHKLWFMVRAGDLHCSSAAGDKGAREICRDAVTVAEQVALRDPNWLIEVARRRLELDEIDCATKLSRGQNLLVLSPIPDAVLAGNSLGSGYNLAKKSTMVRFWRHDDSGLSCRYISLDAPRGGGREALSRAMAELGVEIPANFDSEDILSQRYYFANSDVADELRQNYDHALTERFGGVWHYGQPNLSQKKALEIAMERPDLLRTLMTDLATARDQFYGAKLSAELEHLRYNYAAALDVHRDGRDVATGDMAAIGESARAAGDDYSGNCPTIPENTAEALAALGLNRAKVRGHCPFCKEETMFDPCDPECEKCHSTPSHDNSRESFAKKSATHNKSPKSVDISDLPAGWRVKLTDFGIFHTEWTAFDNKNRIVARAVDKNLCAVAAFALAKR
jgi:hypothetical protein